MALKGDVAEPGTAAMDSSSTSHGGREDLVCETLFWAGNSMVIATTATNTFDWGQSTPEAAFFDALKRCFAEDTIIGLGGHGAARELISHIRSWCHTFDGRSVDLIRLGCRILGLFDSEKSL